MKLEKALKKAARVPKTFHVKLGKMLMSDIKKEVSGGKDVHGQRFTPLTPKYRKYKRKQGGTGKADMKLTGKLLNSKYFKLNMQQKSLLKEYINNVSNSNNLKKYIGDLIPNLKKELKNQVNSIDEKVVKIKLKEGEDGKIMTHFINSGAVDAQDYLKVPVRAIIGDKPKDDVVHPKLKKEFLRVYSERLFREISKIPKKEFL